MILVTGAAGYIGSHTGIEVMPLELGTGTAHSVKDRVKVFKKISKKDVPFCMLSRHDRDIAKCYASPDYTKKSIAEICKDTWRWQSQNPNGYQG